MISTHQLTHRFRERVALADVSLTLTASRIALLGPNGAGKSTLLKLITTVLAPQSGTVKIDGLGTGSRRDRERVRARLGYVPQSMDLPLGFSAEEFLAYAGWMHRVTDIPGRVESALRSVDLIDRRSSRIKSLSGGMRQRLCIAQALVHEPSVLVVDEPSVGLDPQQRVNLRGLLRGLECQLVLATHLVDDVAGVAEDVVVLHHGHVIFHDSVVQLCQGAEVSTEAVERGYLALVEAATP